MKSLIVAAVAIATFSLAAKAQGQSDVLYPRMERIVLSERFFSEGATFADINRDGHQDVISGPFWYAGPDFRQRHAYADDGPYAIAGYSQHFFSFAADFNADGHVDILSIPIPGAAAYWFENPGDRENGNGGDGDARWKKHLALSDVSNESPTFTDITGDGEPELICIHEGAYGYAKVDPKKPTQPWPFVAITENHGYGRFTHGLGVGDINGDGRPDLLESKGWWEQTTTPGEVFRFHAFPFAQSGGSQMFAYDFDGDGDNDVVSVQNAHGWGLKWFEQRGTNGEVAFIARDILPDHYDADALLNISQLHALALADIDGDGVKDIVTGKRFYAHGGRDPGAQQLPVLYWFRTVRGGPEVVFEPHLIDEHTGVGTQLTVGDVTGNGRPDILIGNKLGTSVVLNTGEPTQPRQLPKLMQQIGTAEYAKTVRDTEPLSPEEEQAAFVLPAGFEAQLVVAEPHIAKPMNLAFDADGRLWVTSSEEYPIAASENREARDRIIVLEDRDGDGHRETVTTFAEGLNIPMGLYPYKDGVICFSIPNIWFLRDTDGDGRADTRKKLYGPMGYERDTHGMCNAFTRGFDGWLYSCHGFNNHTTVAGADGHQITMQSGNTFRMKLDGSRIEHFTHGLVNPFGLSQSPTGDLFVADCHTKPISLLLPGGYYDSFGKPHDGLGYVPNVMDHLHGSTAIGGIAQYNANDFPDVYHGNTFGGNVMTGRINRNSLQRHGSSYRAQEEPDLLICGDPWFRPVDLKVGPDGALYVADFYNRIIGHYEVKLDHPGRDRKRGRIWKIVYTGGDQRRDAGSVIERVTKKQKEPTHSQAKTPKQLFAQLASDNLAARMLATDCLVDEFPREAILLATTGLKDKHETTRAHSLWILYRLGRLDEAAISEATGDPAELVRVHAFRVIAAGQQTALETDPLILTGFDDSSALVRRVAVQAAASHNQETLITPLMSLFKATPESDVHLRHTIRMALRDHLRDADCFRQTTAEIDQADIRFIADICLSLNSAAAGEFLVRHIRELSDAEPTVFAEYIRFAVRYVKSDTIGELTAVARERFKDDSDFQLDLLKAAREGFSQRGSGIPDSIRNWALDLASELLGLKDGVLPDNEAASIAWRFEPYPGAEKKGNPFVVTHTRQSSDGMKQTPLISSFPRGESWTGYYRSGSFTITGKFSFYMAGHDGFPGKAPNELNLVRLRDSSTHEVLKAWQPPRNDTAQRFAWSSGEIQARSVYLEIVDGDTANAYAWLAVGRFSIAGLIPTDDAEHRRNGIALIEQFRLTEMRSILTELLQHSSVDLETARQVGRSLASFGTGARLKALAAAISVTGLTTAQRNAIYSSLITGSDAETDELMGQVMKAAIAADQQRIAQALCENQAGAALLVALVEKGQAAPELLRRPAIADSINAFEDEELRQRVAALVKDLPDADESIKQLIVERKLQFFRKTGSAAAGAALFTKNCAICHQVAGKGKKVGPNLDGVGNRGLDRLLEDILAPSRNVDVAFRMTTVITSDGKVTSGLSKGIDGARLILVNSKGEDVPIPRADIEKQVASRRSPMPANLDEKLTEQQFRDLATWLLSLR